jgi:hypothetical protein
MLVSTSQNGLLVYWVSCRSVLAQFLICLFKNLVLGLPSQNGLIVYWVRFRSVLSQLLFCLLKKNCLACFTGPEQSCGELDWF